MSADYTAEQQQDSEEPLHKTQGPYILLQAKLDMTEYNDLVADAYALPSVGGLPPPARNTMEHNMRHITAQCLACQPRCALFRLPVTNLYSKQLLVMRHKKCNIT